MTIKEVIKEALKNADKPLSAPEVGDMIRRLGHEAMHPKSLTSMLSTLVKEGYASVIPKGRSVSGRAEYFDRHIPADNINRHFSAKEGLVHGGTRNAGSSSSERDGFPKRSAEVRYSCLLAYAIVEAMHVVAGSSEFKAIQSLAKEAILSFAAAEPWKEPGFIWVRCNDRNARLTNVSMTVHVEELLGAYRQVGQKLVQMSESDYVEIPNPVVVRDRKQKSDAARVKNSYFMSTAVVWHLISNMPAEHLDNQVIVNFFEYVKGNYVDPVSGVNVVDIYTAINEAVASRERSVIAGREEGGPSEGNAEGLTSNAIHLESQHCQILDAKLENDGSLHFSLRIPRNLLNTLLN